MRRLIVFSLITMLLAASAAPALAYGPRIKDVAKLQGVRSNQLVGYGLVVGLAGTGDSDKSTFTVQSIVNMLKNFGITISTSQLKPKNVGAVMVTAQLPPFIKPGDTIDITVSSLGDAKSLQGGTLLQTPLKAANGAVYAVGQGPLSVGGFSAGGGGASQQKNFPTVGTIPGGAIVERDVPTQFEAGGSVVFVLNKPDFTTASRISEAVDRRFGPISRASDAGSVSVFVPLEYTGNLVGFIAALEELPVTPDSAAKVVVNERTGTVVMGGNVTIDTVAVAQGGLTVRVSSSTEVSQPPPFSGGSTVVTQNKSVDAKEQQAPLIVLPATANVSDLVSALNAVGATPRDVISILQAIKAAGALHAELQLI
ncbi:flagellar basal body P-ring protein FlgI [Anaeroselena agilis]|uniref:Flagellar P-ring protein n=1 Tax=Anaeroselena agilis TaxID=3063788 RepID=A0ABU3P6J6_9FIRM|nr:flagellar basal body P-ring protein FlgI [Selenomonadales bacterium 4137-cl]